MLRADKTEMARRSARCKDLLNGIVHLSTWITSSNFDDLSCDMWWDGGKYDLIIDLFTTLLITLQVWLVTPPSRGASAGCATKAFMPGTSPTGKLVVLMWQQLWQL